jgi:hypothetical protein
MDQMQSVPGAVPGKQPEGQLQCDHRQAMRTKLEVKASMGLNSTTICATYQAATWPLRTSTANGPTANSGKMPCTMPRSDFELAAESVEDKKLERLNEAITLLP